MQWAVLLGALLLIWNSLGDHALMPPDEGRYASVSAWMAEQGAWFSPELRDRSHVTKPPLTYWAQALSMAVLGRTEFAVRLPSAFGATVVVLSMFWFARRVWGPLVAVIAVGAYAIMPLPLIVGRLATTDSLLNAWWWLALCCGYCMYTVEGRARVCWVVAFWVVTVLVGLTKGPLLLVPVMLLVVWLVCAGRWRDVRRSGVLVGLPCALLPLAFVAWMFWQADPERAEAIWKLEFVDRVTGMGVHSDPMWQLAPVFLAGLLPVSAALLGEVFNRPWQRCRAVLRRGDAAGLMLVAAVLPCVGFSLLSGTQPTYLLPVAAPCAVLYAVLTVAWLDGRADARGAKPAVVGVACAAAGVALAVGVPAVVAGMVLAGRAPAWAPGMTLVWWSLVFVPAGVGWWLCGRWWRARAGRPVALACAFIGMCAMWLGMQQVENRAMHAMNARAIAQVLARSARPVLVVGLKDLTIDFYSGTWTDFVYTSEEIAPWLAAHPDGFVVLGIREGRYEMGVVPTDLEPLTEVGRFDVWPFKQALLFEGPRARHAPAE